MALMSRLAAGLAVAGFAVASLTYAVELPSWLAFAYFMAAAVMVGIGVIFCYPYLEKRGYPGFVLGDKAGDPSRWLIALMIVAVLTAALLIITSGADHGTPERGAAGEYLLSYKGTTTVVGRTEWLLAGARGIRVVIGITNFFVCLIAVWCSAIANARPSTA
jgi:hypothetical protein